MRPPRNLSKITENSPLLICKNINEFYGFLHPLFLDIFNTSFDSPFYDHKNYYLGDCIHLNCISFGDRYQLPMQITASLAVSCWR